MNKFAAKQMAGTLALASLPQGLAITSLIGKQRLRSGIMSLDTIFSGGALPLAASYEFTAAEPGETPAVTGFGLALLTRVQAQWPDQQTLYVQERAAGREYGVCYGPGLHAHGLDPDRVIFVSAPSTDQALRNR